MNDLHFNIDHDRIERFKEDRRRIWHYKKVDHIPVDIELYPYYFDEEFHARRRFEDFDVWFECNRIAVQRSLKAIPCDYIPWAGFMSLGPVTIPSLFGAPVHWGTDPFQDPSVGEPVISDMSQVYDLPVPDPYKSGEMPKVLRWIRLFAEQFPEDIHIALPDFEGPLANAASLIDSSLFYTALITHPEEMHHLLDLITRAMIACEKAAVEAAGGLHRLTSINDHTVWQPEGFKGALSDDICANIRPEMFKEFSIPYNNRIYAHWNGGLFHNCGPNPSAHLYLHHDPPIHGYNCSYQFSKDDLPDLKEALGPEAQEKLGYRGHIQAMLEHQQTPEEILAAFQDLMEKLAPDVYAVPCCFLPADNWADDDITQLYWEMRKIADEFAANMRWDEE